MNHIKLFKTTQGWQARFVGPHSQTIKNLFGTDTLPTAFTSDADYQSVLADISDRNPNAIVEVIQ